MPNQPRRGVITMRVTAPGHAGEKKRNPTFFALCSSDRMAEKGIQEWLGPLIYPFCVSGLSLGRRRSNQERSGGGEGKRGEGPLSPLPTPALGQRRKGGGEMGGVTQKMEGIPKN